MKTRSERADCASRCAGWNRRSCRGGTARSFRPARRFLRVRRESRWPRCVPPPRAAAAARARNAAARSAKARLGPVSYGQAISFERRSMVPSMVWPSARAVKFSAMRAGRPGPSAPSRRRARARACLQQGAGAGTQHQRLQARARGPRPRSCSRTRRPRGLACGAHHAEDGLRHLLAHGDEPGERCAFISSVVESTFSGASSAAPVVANSMRRSASKRGRARRSGRESGRSWASAGDSALLLDGVLGRQDVEGPRQVMADARHRHVMLLHGLKQSRLVRAKRGLISSAIISWQNTGPCTNRNWRRPPSLSSRTSEPNMSAASGRG